MFGSYLYFKDSETESENINLWTENGSGDEEVWVSVTNVGRLAKPQTRHL